MAPLRTLTRKITLDDDGTIQTQRPSNTPPTNAVLPTLDTPVGQSVNAAMLPSLAATRTTALALYGTSHIDCPSKEPPTNPAALPMLAIALGHAKNAVTSPLLRLTCITASASNGVNHIDCPS